MLLIQKIFKVDERNSGMIYKPKLPKRWTKELAYIFGLLLGDGSLPKTKSKRQNGKYQERFHIYFISNSKGFLETIYVPLFKKLFELFPRIELVKNKKSVLYNCRIESKQIYQFFEKKGFTVGRKAKTGNIPKLPKKYEVYLLAGLLDTDGGKKGSGFGLSTASENFAVFCMQVFKKLKIPYHSCPWYYNKHIYHQIYVGMSNMQKILKTIPLKNKDKINFIKSYNASVA